MNAEQTNEHLIPMGKIKVITQKFAYHFGNADEDGMRVVYRSGSPLDFNVCIIAVLAVDKSMHLYPDGNASEIFRTSAVASIE